MNTNNSNIFSVINEFLVHIQEINNDVLKLSEESNEVLMTYLNSLGLSLPNNILAVLQYQDIISQQLQGINDTIQGIKNNTDNRKEEENTITLLQQYESILMASLTEAKRKKEIFMGNTLEKKHNDNELNFF